MINLYIKLPNIKKAEQENRITTFLAPLSYLNNRWIVENEICLSIKLIY